jgi:16S rRNA C1402 N4-methylase RsmH
LQEIRALFEAAPKLLKPSARPVVISFHSLGDRIGNASIWERAAGNLDDFDLKARDCR